MDFCFMLLSALCFLPHLLYDDMLGELLHSFCPRAGDMVLLAPFLLLRWCQLLLLYQLPVDPGRAAIVAETSAEVCCKGYHVKG